jgi:hypothetical protein
MNEAMEIQSEKDLAKVGAKAIELYQDVALTSLTAYSMYWLHQWKLRRTIEAVAILNWRLFPEKFAMVGFHEYPDAFRTNRSLLQMQPKYRNLLTGAAVKGFSLNQRGIDIAIELTNILGVPQGDSGESLGSIEKHPISRRSSKPERSIEPEREIEKLRGSKIFEKWKSGIMNERDLIHVHALLGIYDHTPVPVRLNAIKNLENTAKSLNDEEAIRFLADIKKIFPQAFVG